MHNIVLSGKHGSVGEEAEDSDWKDLSEHMDEGGKSPPS